VFMRCTVDRCATRQARSSARRPGPTVSMSRIPDTWPLRTWICPSWNPDETLVPSLLSSPFSRIDLSRELVDGPSAWYIDWGSKPSSSPRWLGTDDLPALAAARRRSTPALFARKFDESATEVLDAIDAELRVS
jgi:hypothetical protein